MIQEWHVWTASDSADVHRHWATGQRDSNWQSDRLRVVEPERRSQVGPAGNEDTIVAETMIAARHQFGVLVGHRLERQQKGMRVTWQHLLIKSVEIGGTNLDERMRQLVRHSQVAMLQCG